MLTCNLLRETSTCCTSSFTSSLGMLSTWPALVLTMMWAEADTGANTGVCVCVRARVCVCMCMHICMHSCMFVCARVCTCIHACVHVHSCVRACVYVHSCTCVHVCVCAFMRVCMCVYVHSFMCRCVQVCVCTCTRQREKTTMSILTASVKVTQETAMHSGVHSLHYKSPLPLMQEPTPSKTRAHCYTRGHCLKHKNHPAD